MHQFFVEPDRIDEGGRRILIQGEDGAHIKNVLRMKAGEEISVRNGLDGREFRCGMAQAFWSTGRRAWSASCAL